MNKCCFVLFSNRRVRDMARLAFCRGMEFYGQTTDNEARIKTHVWQSLLCILGIFGTLNRITLAEAAGI